MYVFYETDSCIIFLYPSLNMQLRLCSAFRSALPETERTLWFVTTFVLTTNYFWPSH